MLDLNLKERGWRGATIEAIFMARMDVPRGGQSVH